MPPTCPPPRATASRRPGTTLIEVVLGLVVLSTLVVSVAMARGRFARQWADADRRLRLTRAADTLIAAWLAGPPDLVPRAGRGPLTTPDAGTWQTRVLPDRGAATLSVVVVRLDVYDAAAPARPAVTIDFLVRDTPVPTTRPAGSR